MANSRIVSNRIRRGPERSAAGSRWTMCLSTREAILSSAWKGRAAADGPSGAAGDCAFAGGRQRERQDGEDLLALQTEERTAGDADGEAGTRAEQVAKQRRRVQNMLQVVQHQQTRPLAQIVDQRLPQRLLSGFA